MQVSLRGKMVSSYSILYAWMGMLSAYMILVECTVYHRVSHTTGGLLIFGLVAGILGGTTAWMVDRRIRQTLARIIEAARRMAQGDLDQRINVETGDKLEELAQAFNQLAAGLSRCQRNLEALHQEQLMRAARMVSLGEMACRIAHEIRNPLAGISGAIQVLSENPSPDHPEELFDKIQQQVDRLDRVMRDFLRYSDLPSPELKSIDINEVLESALFWIIIGCKENQIRLDKALTPSLPHVVGDPSQLEQAFLNICLNALQAMPEGGELRVRTQLTGGEARRGVRISIEDTGLGMDPEVVKRIFLPFFTTKHQGTGLGLAIVHQILTGHQASIEVTSEPRKGSIFTMIFPCIDSRGKESEGKPGSRPFSQENGGRLEQGLRPRERTGLPNAIDSNRPDR
ncbi:MAG: HAMP domain-containing protein [Candidatus Tectomicrobia bacterium]|uniref:histidine kinase n=1 Tax=Tectimicrobiota bacterium TaxID=2528274 RepID=A0A932FZR2_UNCTE|nr:HAMP domain-containing protein [Candidatus Tectomicrobia bacterium]